MSKIYVCEWSIPDLELKGVTDFLFLSTYDYTYHYELEQCKILAHLNKEGYIICKSLDPNDRIIQSIPNKVQCITIWIYENGETVGKYDWNDTHWYYSPRNEKWVDDWKDMINLPVPLQNI